MAGLDRVKGPHWSQILAMFGPGGTINESLKDRNQVQLKDKARNLKLFFLKSHIEVPYYLSFVTGELKTRAPAQAAQNGTPGILVAGEADALTEDRNHIEGVMTLAGGLGMQNGNANGATGPPTLTQTVARPTITMDGVNDDQNPIPTIEGQAGQQIINAQAAAAERARRDSTISAGEDGEGDGNATITVDVHGEGLAARTAAEAAAEAAAAIALMTHGRGA